MITKFRHEVSVCGNSLDILKSGLQKYIRRNILNKALYCANDILLFKNANGGESIVTNLYHRSMIIYLEDIGITSLHLWEIIDKYIESDTLNIVKYMCLSKKTRLASYTRIITCINDESRFIAQNYNVNINEIHKNIEKNMNLKDFDILYKKLLTEKN